MRSLYYFAYDPNMNEKNLHALGISFLYKMKGTLFGYELVFSRNKTSLLPSGIATIIPNKKSFVEGIIYELEDTNIWGTLDYRAYDLYHYERKHLKAVFSDTLILPVNVYVAKEPEELKTLDPTNRHLADLLTAEPYLSAPYYERLQNVRTY